jgi:hypothetical protein
VDAANPIFTYWYFHLPNFFLAAVMYTLIGRFVLGFIFDERSDNFIWRFFIRITDPVAKVVGYFTPLAVPPTIVLLLAVVWVFAIRCLLLVGLIAAGAGPTTGVIPQ